MVHGASSHCEWRVGPRLVDSRTARQEADARRRLGPRIVVASRTARNKMMLFVGVWGPGSSRRGRRVGPQLALQPARGTGRQLAYQAPHRIRPLLAGQRVGRASLATHGAEACGVHELHRHPERGYPVHGRRTDQ